MANAVVVGGRRAESRRVHLSRAPGRTSILAGDQEHTGRKRLGKRLVESAQLYNRTIVMFRLGLRKVKAQAQVERNLKLAKTG